MLAAMDSLLANYASSDEEEEEHKLTPPKTTTSFPSLPQPKSSLFQSLPQPKSSSSSLFQSLPPPKQSTSVTSSESANPKLKPKPQIEEPQPKRVVQFRPPIIPLPNPAELVDDDDDDEEEEERIRRKKKLESSTQTSSVKSFLASIPAPRNTATLGVQAGSGSGRRSIIETESPASDSGGLSSVPVDQSAGDYESYENYDNYQYATDQYASYYGNYGSGTEPGSSGTDPEAGVAAYGTEQHGNYGETYGAYGDYGQYGNNWGGVLAAVPEASGIGDSMVRIPGKRGRHEVPTEVIEVKQEELIKNRPREDQVKLTGIAFGPTYQPPVSTKGKPSKLHKRKHQIGSLYFDMKQNEMKLAERRAKGMLTKAETQAKYGW